MLDLKEELKKNNYSIIASNGYYSFDDGIKPVLYRINENREFFKGLDVADKIIGKASAMLLVYSGVNSVNALVMSKSAIEIFKKYGVSYSYDEYCEYIINRTKDGMCPMEETVKDIDDFKIAYKALNDKVNSIINKK